MNNEIKVMNNDEIRDFCIKKDLKIYGLEQEIERLNNIIKEVREYIMTNGIHSDYGDKGIDDENKLLEILDKEKDNE